MEGKAEILVMGIGNVLLTDEGVGVRVVNELQRRYRFSDQVDLLDGGTAGIELLRHINRRKHLIIIDALAGGRPPGTVSRIEGDEVPAIFRTRISPHQLGLSDLLAAAMLTGELPDNLVLFGVEPKDLGTGLDLSATVENSLDQVITVVLEELDEIGVDFTIIKKEFFGKARFWENTRC